MPRGQEVQESTEGEPGEALSEAGHCRQNDELVAGLYVFTGQSAHAAEPAWLAYDPGWHGEQAGAAESGA